MSDEHLQLQMDAAAGEALATDAARSAFEIAQKLREAGHEALLAGGCVRDLLLGRTPSDFDVATNAAPERVCALFRATRQVGAQFGVVLVRRRRRWVEVATFRSDGTYSDGRRPDSVTFGDARADALRRDFTVNGMFLDPASRMVIDYVGGRADLERRVVRAIGEPAARFEEDHLRLLRAVRFAARLGFEIEAQTFAAMRASAEKLERVAAERVLDELERMLSHDSRARAVRLMRDAGLLQHLWAGAAWNPDHVERAVELLDWMSEGAEVSAGPFDAAVGFEAALAVLVGDRKLAKVDELCRGLTLSNEQREAVVWLVRHQGDLDEPEQPTLAELKRLMAHRAFGYLRAIATSRYGRLQDDESEMQKAGQLRQRLEAIRPEDVAPTPFVTGEDLIALCVPVGPVYKRVLDEVYTRQLDEAVRTREDALRVMEGLLAANGP